LKGVRVMRGRVTALDHDARRATFQPAQGSAETIAYDILVMAAGSITRTLPIPGLAENAAGFKTVGEAVHLRNQVLTRLAAAATGSCRGGRACLPPPIPRYGAGP